MDIRNAEKPEAGEFLWRDCLIIDKRVPIDKKLMMAHLFLSAGACEEFDDFITCLSIS
jgi:hypothetical protein